MRWERQYGLKRCRWFESQYSWMERRFRSSLREQVWDLSQVGLLFAVLKALRQEVRWHWIAQHLLPMPPQWRRLRLGKVDVRSRDHELACLSNIVSLTQRIFYCRNSQSKSESVPSTAGTFSSEPAIRFSIAATAATSPPYTSSNAPSKARFCAEVSSPSCRFAAAARRNLLRTRRLSFACCFPRASTSETVAALTLSISS